MSRPPRPDDLYGLRVPVDVRVSPDGRNVAFVVKEPSPDKDGYRQSIWLAPFDGSEAPRRLTLGTKNDTSPRWSPDGTTIAFLSDRGSVLEAGGGSDRPREVEEPGARPRTDQTQVWLLRTDGGEAHQLTRLPDSVLDLSWSPDGTRLCIVSPARTAERRKVRREPGQPPERDMHMIDRLQFMLNGEGYTYDRPPNLWVIGVADGVARRITSGDSRDEHPAWSPDGKTICFTSDRHADSDLSWRQDLYLVAAGGGRVTRLTGGRGDRHFTLPAWAPDGRSVAAVGHRFPVGDASRSDVWRFPIGPESAGENLTGHTDLEVSPYFGSDLFGSADGRLAWSPRADWIMFAAPMDGAVELWRVRTSDCHVERLTEGEHALTRPDAISVGSGLHVAAVRMAGNAPPDVVALEVPAMDASRTSHPKPITERRLSHLTGEGWKDVAIVPPVGRWHEVDGRRIQGWFLEAPRKGGKPAPLVVQIHGGPSTMYGWSLFWEWQCLVAGGVSVYACNPRGSQGYGQDFNHANFRDWGDGPMADIMGGVDSLVADGLVDGDRLGVTGGSYGGYLTSWMVGHTNRFKAAVSCRAVNDMTSEMLSGDIAGPTFGKHEYGANPWEDPELFRAHSPISYAADIHTPLLIQHAEKDLRCPITQGEELFAILRSLKRPVRFMRVPDESHELTRSGAPFRRVENIERIRDWFSHYLVHGRDGLPPI